jgi:hypothetical protein
MEPLIAPAVRVTENMQRISLDHYYTFGRVMALLEECFAIIPCDITERDLSRIRTATRWLDRFASGEWAIIPRSAEAASKLTDALHALLTAHEQDPNAATGKVARLDKQTQAQLNALIGAFNGVIRSNSEQVYILYVHEKSAYSARALVECARLHLSDDAQKNTSDSEKVDFDLAGRCYALDLHTATGFHAMRALEAEARRYHKVVTAQPLEVDWTLNPLINGNSGRDQVGLRDV